MPGYFRAFLCLLVFQIQLLNDWVGTIYKQQTISPPPPPLIIPPRISPRIYIYEGEGNLIGLYIMGFRDEWKWMTYHNLVRQSLYENLSYPLIPVGFLITQFLPNEAGRQILA